MAEKIQLIDSHGTFNVLGLESFSKSVKLGEPGLSYMVVSIIGPQSSGKSTLLNNLFGTNFTEMEAGNRRYQTTKGIWLSKAIDAQPYTLVLDVEGSDGVERGQDDTSFERQSALFAIALSDVVLINTWCHDIGREHGGNRPLLSTVFQVMMHLFPPKRTTLLFVLRDKTRKVPLEVLENQLREGIQQIYDAVKKPQAHHSTLLSEYFDVQVTALPNYEQNENLFNEEVANLSFQLKKSVGDKFPASEFPFTAQTIWDTVQNSRDLHLPPFEVMRASVRCDKAVEDGFSCFKENEDWCRLAKDVQSCLIVNFGNLLSNLLHTCLSRYDAEVQLYDKDVAFTKREYLRSQVLQLVQPAYLSMMAHLHTKTFKQFRESFAFSIDGGKKFVLASTDCISYSISSFHEGWKDAAIEQSNWTSSEPLDKIQKDIDAHVASMRDFKLLELTFSYERNLQEALSKPVKNILAEGRSDTWPTIRRLLSNVTDPIISSVSNHLTELGIERQTRDEKIARVKLYATDLVRAIVKKQAKKVLDTMKARFQKLFRLKSDSSEQRIWDDQQDIPAIAKEARAASLQLLSLFAAIQLDVDVDSIAPALQNALLSRETELNALASNTWELVLSEDTLYTPVECKKLWAIFYSDTEGIITCAIDIQRANAEIVAARADAANVTADADARLRNAQDKYDRLQLVMTNLYNIAQPVVVALTPALVAIALHKSGVPFPTILNGGTI